MRSSKVFPSTLLCALAFGAILSKGCSQQAAGLRSKASSAQAHPESAIPGILGAFKTYEIVAMPAAHGEKDMDDLILSLLRDPRFPAAVDDIVIECGNMRLQAVLDRYIAGEEVSFAEVRHVWRDTTVQQMCGTSGFYEQLVPLVRALNRTLPANARLRVVAADPPIDWDRIHSYDDLRPFFDRDGNIASVMESEVLSRHRKALMLFGTAHLIHGGGPGDGDAVTRYEKHFPGKTFVIAEFWDYNISSEPFASLSAPGGAWPSLIRTKGSSFGKLPLDAFFESPITTDKDCNVREAFPADPSHPVVDRIDAFLYLGPQRPSLGETMPADIALDKVYMAEWLRRMHVVGMPGPSTLDEFDTQIVGNAGQEPSASLPRAHQTLSPEMKARVRQNCLATNTKQ